MAAPNNYFVQGQTPGGMPPTMMATPQQTPGGLGGTIGNTTMMAPQAAPSYTAMAQNTPSYSSYRATSNPGVSGSNVGDFSQYTQSAFDQGLSRLQPQIDAQNRALQGQLVARGLEPGTAAFQAAMDQQGRTNNDMYNSLNANAMQQGLAAQNQAWQQQFGYDQLNSRERMNSANVAAQRYGADMNHQLGLARLDENARQANMADTFRNNQLIEQGRHFDVNDIFRNQQLDANTMLGLGSLYNQSNQINTQNALAQANLNNMWFGQGQQMLGQAPNAQFAPGPSVTGAMAQQGQAAANADAGMWGSVTNGIGALFGASDIRMKQNIDFIDTVDGVDVYEFEYKDPIHGEGRYRGTMSHSIKDKYPSAVKSVNGVDMVDYSQLPIDMERVA